MLKSLAKLTLHLAFIVGLTSPPAAFTESRVVALDQTSATQTTGVGASQPSQTRSPSEVVREFYKAMREKRFRDAFSISIYKPAFEGLTKQEYDDLLPDFEKVALAVSERIPENLELTGEQISGDVATVFVSVVDGEGKKTIEPTTLIKVNNQWILGKPDEQELVRKAGKQFFFDARINAHHDDVQDMLTRISLVQVVYSQQHNGQFADLPTLIAAGLVPKDIEGTASTGYRFRITVAPDRKSWHATAEPAEYGRTGKLSFFLDASGVRSGDVQGKPLPKPGPKDKPPQ